MSSTPAAILSPSVSLEVRTYLTEHHVAESRIQAYHKLSKEGKHVINRWLSGKIVFAPTHLYIFSQVEKLAEYNIISLENPDELTPLQKAEHSALKALFLVHEEVMAKNLASDSIEIYSTSK